MRPISTVFETVIWTIIGTCLHQVTNFYLETADKFPHKGARFLANSFAPKGIGNKGNIFYRLIK